MKPILQISIPIGIGDLIHLKAQLDSVKNVFEKIEISFYEPFFTNYRNNDSGYKEFIIKFFKLLFQDARYHLVDYQEQPFRNCSMLCEYNRIFPARPRFKHILCRSLYNQYGDYITVSTKVRQFPFSLYQELKEEYFRILSSLSYKIMILGEREIEYNQEYTHLGNQSIYSLYSDYLQNLPADKIIDLTIPKLGITTPNFDQLMHDCSLMGNAKYNLFLGIGGNFSLGVAIGNSIGYRDDNDHVAEILYKDTQYLDLLITKNKERFLDKLRNLKV